MLSIIIPTLNSERALIPTLATLVPGATAGFVTEVLVADGGSQDDTAAVADVAGCNFMAAKGSLASRLKAAAAVARAPWLMFLQPGTVLDTTWTSEVGRFVQQDARQEHAAVFRRGGETALRQLLGLVPYALGLAPHQGQGLLITKAFYNALGGHPGRGRDPERDLLRRIGRSRLVQLASQAFQNNT